MKLKEHFTIKSVLGAITWAFILVWFWYLLILCYEFIALASFFLEYNSITPLYPTYGIGQEVRMVSNVDRKSQLYQQRQDTAYCEYKETIVKLPTQYRPSEIWFQFMQPWQRETVWVYSVEIPKVYKRCKMCSDVIIKTKRWVQKEVSYCTNFFLVNQIWNSQNISIPRQDWSQSCLPWACQSLLTYE